MKIQNIPYVFIKIGEDIEDITILNNWTSDIPEEIETFDVERSIADADEGCYEIITEDDVDDTHLTFD